MSASMRNYHIIQRAHQRAVSFSLPAFHIAKARKTFMFRCHQLTPDTGRGPPKPTCLKQTEGRMRQAQDDLAEPRAASVPVSSILSFINTPLSKRTPSGCSIGIKPNDALEPLNETKSRSATPTPLLLMQKTKNAPRARAATLSPLRTGRSCILHQTEMPPYRHAICVSCRSPKG